MMLLTNDNYFDEVSAICSNGEPLDIAVAFFGEKAASLFKTNAQVRIICNLESGACNPNAIVELKKRSNIDIKTCCELHSKVLIQKSKAIIGSANLSANGLSFEDDESKGWIETGILTTDEKLIKKSQDWFESLWAKADVITDEKIKEAKEKWKKRRNQRPLDKSNKSFFEAVTNNPEKLKDRNIFFVIYPKGNTSPEADAAYKDNIAKFPELKNTGYYENWKKLPDDAWLIDLPYSKNETLAKNNITIWKTPEEAIIVEFESGSIKLCFKKNSIEGLKLNNDDKDKIKDIFSQLVKKDTIKKTGYDVIPFNSIMDDYATKLV